MSSNSLHVTNGDSVVYSWKKAGLLGTHLSWSDVLSEGPVPAGLPLDALSRVRAQYLAQAGYGNPIRINHELEKRDAIIKRAREFDEVVLWFEHDLFDQLHLLQILSVFDEIRMSAGSIQLIQSEQYLGILSPDELIALYPKRRFVTTAIAQGAAHAWAAFTASAPASLQAAAAQRYTGLPFLHDALVRLCEEYPAIDSGLSRSQKQILEAVAQGARKREDVFSRSQAKEEASFMGDAPCYREIDALCAEPAPLLCELESGYDLTVLGRRVLAGDADWLEHQPLDRWIGGVHLNGERHWRWDDRANAFVERLSQARS